MREAAGGPLESPPLNPATTGLRSLRLAWVLMAAIVSIWQGVQALLSPVAWRESLDVPFLAFAILGAMLVWPLTKAAERWLEKGGIRPPVASQPVRSPDFETEGISSKSLAGQSRSLDGRRWRLGRSTAAAFGVSALLLVSLAWTGPAQQVARTLGWRVTLGDGPSVSVSTPDSTTGLETVLPPPAVSSGLALEVPCHQEGHTGPVCVLYTGWAWTLDLATFTDSLPSAQHTALVDWGDGTLTEGIIDEENGTIKGRHSYVAPGLYEIRVSVSSGTGESVAASMLVSALSLYTYQVDPPATPADTHAAGRLASAFQFSKRAASHSLSGGANGGWGSGTGVPV